MSKSNQTQYNIIGCIITSKMCALITSTKVLYEQTFFHLLTYFDADRRDNLISGLKHLG